MPTNNLGRRYERLLLIAAPLSFVSILVLFIAIALTTQQGRAKARCYESAVTVLSAVQNELETVWEKEKPVTKPPYWGPEYRLKGAKALIFGLRAGDCYDVLKPELDQRFRSAPSEIIKKLKQDAQEAARGPVQLYGVEIPEKASVNLIGTTVKFELGTLMALFQIVLGPMLILWLGSLYNTRYRESQLIFRAATITETFPHIVNIYPVVRLPEARKKSWVIYCLPVVVGVLYSIGRAALLAIFIAPPAAAYIASLIVFPPERFILLFVVFGFLVCINSLAVIASEFHPWHIKKVFPGLDRSR